MRSIGITFTGCSYPWIPILTLRIPDEVEPGLYRRMLGYNVTEEGGWSQGASCCVAAGGGKGGAKRREGWVCC